MLRLLHIALMFYTRIPCPSLKEFNDADLNRATMFFPLIGWLIGLASGLSCMILLPHMSAFSAVLLSTTVGILLTGAFHEDGFADTCDGFGGGWTRERILTIMKDSRIGVYGALGLLLMLLTKVSLLSDLALGIENGLILLLIFINAHTLSRYMATICIYCGDYARDNDDTGAKAKPIGKGLNTRQFIVASGFALLPLSALLITSGSVIILAAPLLMLLVTWRAQGYFNKWVGGYTGDCLGAVQQITEAAFYLGMVLLLA